MFDLPIVHWTEMLSGAKRLNRFNQFWLGTSLVNSGWTVPRGGSTSFGLLARKLSGRNRLNRSEGAIQPCFWLVEVAVEPVVQSSFSLVEIDLTGLLYGSTAFYAELHHRSAFGEPHIYSLSSFSLHTYPCYLLQTWNKTRAFTPLSHIHTPTLFISNRFEESLVWSWVHRSHAMISLSLFLSFSYLSFLQTSSWVDLFLLESCVPR